METPQISFGLMTWLDDPWDDLVAQWHEFEVLGVDSAWLPDHIGWGLPRYEVWTALAGLACRTQRIRLGTLVTSTAFRNPVVFAKEVLTVDYLARGRLELGLGAGYDPSDIDHAMTGLPSWPPAERVQRFREALEIIDRLLRGETVTYEGRYHRVRDASLSAACLQRPRPPLTIAGYGPAMLRLAAAYADTFNSGDLDSRQGADAPAVFAATRDRFARLDEYCREAGRDPRSLKRSIYRFGSDRPGAEELWASVDAFTDFVGRYREIGVSEFIFRYPPGDRDRPPAFERIVTEAMPALRMTL
jgi:alkanesulfonate monooxygenase SsuD/methylene tetrahydromethanopterin reductase-like flavin-dependent oxidoreductase (luciferase family)